jgi:hypothetical protein
MLILEECRLWLCDNSASERLGGSRGCRPGGVIALVLTSESSALEAHDPPVVAHGVVARRGLDKSILRVVPAHSVGRDAPSLLSPLSSDRPDREKNENEANGEMRNMRSDDDLSHDGSGIGQKSNPTFTVSSSMGVSR